MSTRVVNWNIAWRRPRSVAGVEILRRIDELQPQVVCLTEGHTDFLPANGHLIHSAADYGYRAPATRRKVLLWSQRPWRDVDDFGDAALPSGRFVAGTTGTDAGPLRFVGVCVPWKDAHVRTGRKDRRRWQDHLVYLRGLNEYLRRVPLGNVVLLGDFNQTVPPRNSAPAEVRQAFSALWDLGLSVATGAVRGTHGAAAIDHIAVGPEIVVRSVETVCNETTEGQLSDHFGVTAVLIPCMSRPTTN